jgi:hypothetical protein
MAEWGYFIHPPRENFAATMTEAAPMGGRSHQVLARSWANT